MRKAFTLFSILALALAGVMATPDESSAVPAFARQTGNPCYACHFQYFPKLNAFGRAFKLGGFTDASSDLIEDDMISIPAVFNASLVTKIRYIKTNPKTSPAVESGEQRGQWDVPDEAVLFFGGRLSANAGFDLEYDPATHGGWANGKFLYSMPVGDNRVGLTVFSTDGASPGWGISMDNTGIMRGVRGFESRKEYSIFQKLGIATAATGLGVYAGGEMFFANVSLWGPQQISNAPIDTGFNLSTFYNVAVTPSVAGWDLMLGVVGEAGETKCVACLAQATDTTAVERTIKTEFFGVYGQAQGEFGNGMTLELQAQYATAGGDPSANKLDLYKKSDGFSAAAMLGINPMLGVKVAYVSYTDKSGTSDVDTQSTVLGLWLNLAQNISIVPEYSSYSGDGRSDDSKYLIMLFFGA